MKLSAKGLVNFRFDFLARILQTPSQLSGYPTFRDAKIDQLAPFFFNLILYSEDLAISAHKEFYHSLLQLNIYIPFNKTLSKNKIRLLSP